MKINQYMNTRARRRERIIQFGEGNFLRAFADWIVLQLNEKTDFDSDVVVVQPIETGMADQLNAQEGYYTLLLLGQDGEKSCNEQVICDSISRAINPYTDFEEFLNLAINPDFRFVISNTTEAGIAFNRQDRLDDAPPQTYPGKLTRLLYRRFQAFAGSLDKGFILLPCELIDRNGDKLKETVLAYAKLWSLEPEFSQWIKRASIFCNTLVDRIVPGYPRARAEEWQRKLGYEDALLVEAELYYSWVIETLDAQVQAELPVDAAGLNVVFTENLEPYRTKKVRILNGVHTAVASMCYLCGYNSQSEVFNSERTGDLFDRVVKNEILPTLDGDPKELDGYAEKVMERFRNPYIDYQLLQICLNSVSKFRVRVLPTLATYIEKYRTLPTIITLGLASLIVFYRGKRNDEAIPLRDDRAVLDRFGQVWNDFAENRLTASELVGQILRDTTMWGEDLNGIPGLTKQVTEHLENILRSGALNEMKRVVYDE